MFYIYQSYTLMWLKYLIVLQYILPHPPFHLHRNNHFQLFSLISFAVYCHFSKKIILNINFLVSLFIIFLVGRVFRFTPDPAFPPQPTVTLLFILPYLLSYVNSLPFPSQYIVYYLFVVVGIVC